MVTVGLVGAGFMGQMHAACHGALPNAKLVGVADVQKRRAAALARQFGAKGYDSLDHLVQDQDPDVIDVCLPTDQHCEYVLRAARMGKHVLCEKPMARTVAEADRMLAAVKKARVKFMVAHCIRFWPEYAALKKMADSGKFGRLTSLYLSRMSPTPTWAWQGWLLDPGRSGGALLDLHIHDADYVLHLLGKPRAVNCVAVKSKIGYSHIFTTYGYPGKAVVACGGWDLPAQFPFNMAFRANFERATVDFNMANSPTMLVYRGNRKPLEPKVDKPEVKGGAAGGNISDLGGYFNEIQYFINCVERGRTPKIVTPKDARNSVALVLAEQKSAESGRPVKVSLK